MLDYAAVGLGLAAADGEVEVVEEPAEEVNRVGLCCEGELFVGAEGYLLEEFMG